MVFDHSNTPGQMRGRKRAVNSRLGNLLQARILQRANFDAQNPGATEVGGIDRSQVNIALGHQLKQLILKLLVLAVKLEGKLTPLAVFHIASEIGLVLQILSDAGDNAVELLSKNALSSMNRGPNLKFSVGLKSHVGTPGQIAPDVLDSIMGCLPHGSQSNAQVGFNA